jgi:hypothetical protein
LLSIALLAGFAVLTIEAVALWGPVVGADSVSRIV